MTDRQAIDGAAGAAITHQPDTEKRDDEQEQERRLPGVATPETENPLTVFV